MPSTWKEWIVTFGAGITAAVFGAWSPTMTILIAFMIADYVTGCLVAAIKGDGLDSRIGALGLLKKFGMIGLVALAHQLDIVLGTSILRDTCALLYLANEAISITENAGKLGIWVPEPLIKAIAVLKNRAEQPETNDDKSQPGTIDKGAAE